MQNNKSGQRVSVLFEADEQVNIPLRAFQEYLSDLLDDGQIIHQFSRAAIFRAVQTGVVRLTYSPDYDLRQLMLRYDELCDLMQAEAICNANVESVANEILSEAAYQQMLADRPQSMPA